MKGLSKSKAARLSQFTDLRRRGYSADEAKAMVDRTDEDIDRLRQSDAPDESPVMQVLHVGYLCIQGYPNRICSGCTSACSAQVYVETRDE